MPVPWRCAVVVPKNVFAGVHGPEALVLASIKTFTVTLVPLTRQSAWTEPLMLAPVSAWVVASSTTEPPAFVNVSVTRVKVGFGPPFAIAVWPV
jgi:hypothetical protein